MNRIQLLYKIKLDKALNRLSSDDIIVADYRYDEGLRVRENGNSPTLTCKVGGTSLSANPLIIKKETYEGDNIIDNVRIRKLTPTECYKLMGFTEDDCKKCSENGISNVQLYKQAGNSIVVNVLEAIFTSLGEYYDEFKPE